MKYQISTYSIFLLLLHLEACVEPFSPSVDKYEDALVVDALITNDPSQHFVKLSRTRPLHSQESGSSFETGASVSLVDSGGKTFEFSESFSSPGVYSSSITPEVGKAYILSITTREGKVYNSDPVVMKETPRIDSLYFGRSTIPSDEYGGLDDGFQIYVETSTGSGQPGYYKFDWEETWELVTPYHSFFDIDLQKDSIFERKDNLSNCWIQSSSTNLNLESTENLSSYIIKNHPIRFISFRKSFLRVKYNILVKQYALSQDGYYFWKSLEESSELTGSLYDKQPSQPVGNIKNIDDPTEVVLGYFEMATISSKRITISPKDLPAEVTIPSLYSDCLQDVDTVVSRSQVTNLIGAGYLISREILGSGFEMVIKNCIDCRLKGSNLKPEFWD